MIIKTAIIGAYKAGSSSLKEYMSNHPNISSHHQLEFTYFYHDSEESLRKTIEKQFDHKRTDQNVHFLIKHVALYRNPQALQRLKDHNPDIKIIFIVREPIARAYSAYKMEVERSGFNNDFSELLRDLLKQETKSFLYRIGYEASLYGKSLEKILEIFPLEQVYIADFVELKKSPEELCRRLFEFIAVDEYDAVQATTEIVNQSKKPKFKWLQDLIIWMSREDNILKQTIRSIVPYSMFVRMAERLRRLNQSSEGFSPLSEEMKDGLFPFFKADIEKFERLSGLNFEHWKR